MIPLLSGHLGGANELAERLAEGLAKNGIPAQAVLTTATDVNRRFAVDVFAKEHGLVLDQMKLAKEISAAVLAGEPVGLFSDFPFSGHRSRRGFIRTGSARKTSGSPYGGRSGEARRGRGL